MGAVGNGNNQWEWKGNGDKIKLSLRSGMGMDHWEWEGIRLKKTFPLISVLASCSRRLAVSYTV